MPEIEIPMSFKRKLGKKTSQQQARIMECVDRLATDPRSPGLHTHAVRSVPGVFEAYVDKANRVTFRWDGPVIVLRVHCNHDILRRP